MEKDFGVKLGIGLLAVVFVWWVFWTMGWLVESSLQCVTDPIFHWTLFCVGVPIFNFFNIFVMFVVMIIAFSLRGSILEALKRWLH